MVRIEVPIGECRCPGAPHEGDIVWMKPNSDLMMALAATSALNQASEYAGDNEAAVYSVYVRHGVVAWNITDENGPVPVTYDNILDRLRWLQGGKIVALKGREMYHGEIFDPLAQPRPASRPHTPSNGSMSRSPSSGQKRRISSRPSSLSGPVVGQ